MTRRSSESEQRQAREIAEAVLSGRMTILEGARALVPLALDGDAIRSEKDRNLIIAIDSETDQLPVGGVRKNWGSAALQEKDVEIARAEARWREAFLALCGRVVDQR